MESKFYYKIGNNIRCLREAFDLTQEELANGIGVVKHAVSQYETGASIPKKDILIKIAKFFHITETELLQNDYSKFKKVVDTPINNDEYNKKMFEKLFPLVSSKSSRKNNNFEKAYKHHKKICDVICSDVIAEDIDETSIEECMNLYKKARDEGIIEACANHLWLICYIGFLISFCDSRTVEAAKKLKRKDIDVKSFFMNAYLTSQNNKEDGGKTLIDDKEDMEKKESKKFFWEEFAVDFYVNIRKLKLNSKYSDLGDYYLAIAYVFDIICNGMSREQNSAIGSEMLSVFSLMGNEYADLSSRHNQ